jgi:hypothetical protein
MKHRLAAFASAIAFACAPAFVQAAPASSASPALVDAAKQLLVTMKSRETMAAAFRQIETQMPAQMAAATRAAINNNPRLNDKQKAEALDKMQQSLAHTSARMHEMLADPTLIDEIIEQVVPLYAETYTLDELHQLSAFYASPLGQKMLNTMPQLMGRSMEISNRVMMPRIQKVVAEEAAASAGH